MNYPAASGRCIDRYLGDPTHDYWSPGFSLTMSGYNVFGVKMEERDLIANHGERYLRYKDQVPGLIPSLRKKELEEVIS